MIYLRNFLWRYEMMGLRRALGLRRGSGGLVLGGLFGGILIAVFVFRNCCCLLFFWKDSVSFFDSEEGRRRKLTRKAE